MDTFSGCYNSLKAKYDSLSITQEMYLLATINIVAGVSLLALAQAWQAPGEALFFQVSPQLQSSL